MANAHGVPPLFVAWSRFTFGAMVLLLFMIWRGLDLRIFFDWRILLRGGLIVGTVSSILTAVQTESLATSFGAFFIGPILSYFLSAWLLREPITRTRTLLMVLGFGGVLLVVKPGFGFTIGMGYAVLAGIFYGGFLTTNRWLNAKIPAHEMMFSQVVIGTLVLMPFALPSAPEMTWAISRLVLASALCSNIANILLIVAYTRVEASRLAPFVYFQLIAATAMGYIVFDTIPDLITLAGLLLLIASGVASVVFRSK